MIDKKFKSNAPDRTPNQAVRALLSAMLTQAIYGAKRGIQPDIEYLRSPPAQKLADELLPPGTILKDHAFIEPELA